MNEQNLNNVIVIDRISKKVLNDPQIEIDEEVYAEAVSRLVEKLLVGLREKSDLKNLTREVCFHIKSQTAEKLRDHKFANKFIYCVNCKISQNSHLWKLNSCFGIFPEPCLAGFSAVWEY